nr:PKD domain-containing protein [Bacteroidales bacterium]
RIVDNGFVDWGDYNNDGYPDLVLSGISGNKITKVYENNKDGSFFEVEGISIDGANDGSTTWGDYDSDGDLDILVNGEDIRNNPITKVYTNNSNYKNLPPIAPENLQSETSGTGMKLSWDKSYDPDCPEGNVYYNLRIGSSPGKADILTPFNIPGSTQRTIPGIGNAFCSTFYIINDLEPEKQYYWSVQAIDHSYKGGDWAEEQILDVSIIRANFEADTVCFGSSTNFSDLSLTTKDTIIEWKWDFGDTESSSEQNPVHTYSEAGTFAVTLIAFSDLHSDTSVKTVFVKKNPVADFSVEPVCHGDWSEFINLSDTKGLEIASWTWDFGEGPVSYQMNADSHFYSQTGEYSAQLLVRSTNGCSDSISKVATVAKYPEVIVTANGPIEFCEGEEVVLSVEENKNYRYQWKLNDIPLSDSVYNHCKAIFKGSYSVDVENTLAGCFSSSTPIVINAVEQPVKPLVRISGFDPDKCPEGEIITLDVIDATSLYQYQWKKGGNPIPNAIGSTFEEYLGEGNYTVVAANGRCKTTSDEINIYFNYDISEKPSIIAEGPNVWYLACSNANANYYRWYYEDQLIDKANEFLYVADQQLGKYVVSVSNLGGCFIKSDPIWIPFTTGIEDDPWQNLKIYPNPTPGLFTLEMDNYIMGDLIIDIFGENGSKVINIKFRKETSMFMTQIDLSEQPSAFYLIGLALDEWRTTRSLVVE